MGQQILKRFVVNSWYHRIVCGGLTWSRRYIPSINQSKNTNFHEIGVKLEKKVWFVLRGESSLSVPIKILKCMNSGSEDYSNERKILSMIPVLPVLSKLPFFGTSIVLLYFRLTSIIDRFQDDVWMDRIDDHNGNREHCTKKWKGDKVPNEYS